MSQKPADSAFTMLFNEEKHVVDLYEFLTGIRLEPHTIKSVRLQDGMVRSRLYNDVSFITYDARLTKLNEVKCWSNPTVTTSQRSMSC